MPIKILWWQGENNALYKLDFESFFPINFLSADETLWCEMSDKLWTMTLLINLLMAN